MNHKIYKIPDPAHFTDTSQPYNKDIANLLLAFDCTSDTKEKITKLVTVPADNGLGCKVVASQFLLKGIGNAVYVFLPETERIYRFREAILPVRDPIKRFLKAGIKGLFLGAEEKGIVEKMFCNQSEEKDELENELSKSFVSYNNDWYHFTGTAGMILTELKKRCASLQR